MLDPNQSAEYPVVRSQLESVLRNLIEMEGSSDHLPPCGLSFQGRFKFFSLPWHEVIPHDDAGAGVPTQNSIISLPDGRRASAFSYQLMASHNHS